MNGELSLLKIPAIVYSIAPEHNNEGARPIDQLVEEICKKAGINEKELRMGGRRRKVSETRAEISYRLNCESGIPAAEIAMHLGVSTSSITRTIEKMERNK